MLDKERRFIIRKYVMAETAAEAIQKDHETIVDEVFLDEGEQTKPKTQLSCIGFRFRGETG